MERQTSVDDISPKMTAENVPAVRKDKIHLPMGNGRGCLRLQNSILNEKEEILVKIFVSYEKMCFVSKTEQQSRKFIDFVYKIRVFCMLRWMRNAATRHGSQNYSSQLR